MQRLTCVVFINLVPTTTGRDRASCALGQIAISLVTSLVPRLRIEIFGLGTRLLVRMRTKLQNGVLRNGQQPQCCEWLLLTRVKLKL